MTNDKKRLELMVSGRLYASSMYPIEYAFDIRDEFLAPVGQLLAAGITAQDDASRGALELFTGASARAALKGGSFAFYKKILAHTTRVEKGEHGPTDIPILWDDFAGDLEGVEMLVWAVLKHNFEAYFLAWKRRVERMIDPNKAPAWIKVLLGLEPESSSDAPGTSPPPTV